MSYQVLARKWRPSDFSQVAGQSHVLKSLINALDNQRLHHAYLFTGTRGVGKTTLARILAKCLNCEQGISSKPCEECNACTEINEGRFIDLIEVDAASRTRVEDTRELLENVQYTPARGRFKVYLIDEVHMLSNHSFNALLKTLEEPPPHVKFLFATTDPQKLPVTILSRCLQFNLKNLSPQVIVDYLIKVLQQENISFDDDALWQLATAASGSMRDALTLVDQAIAFCQGQITADGVVEMLGVPEQQQVYSLLEAMAAKDVAAVIALTARIAEQTPDFAHTLDSLLSALHRIAIAQVLPGAADNSFGDKRQIRELASRFTAEDIQLYYQFGVKGRDDLRSAADMRSAFEMLLLRMIVFSPEYTPLEHTEAGAQSVSTPADVAVAAEPPQVDNQKKKNDPLTDATQPVALEGESIQPASADDESGDQDAGRATTDAEPGDQNTGRATTDDEPGDQDTGLAAADDKPDDQNTGQAAADDEPGDQNTDLAANDDEPGDQNTGLSTAGYGEQDRLAEFSHERWLQLYPRLEINGMAANILANTQFERLENDTLYFTLDHDQSAVFNKDLLPRLAQAVSEALHRPLDVEIEVGKVQAETPAHLSRRLKQEHHDEMVNEFEQDRNVQEMMKHFSATVAVESIAPVKHQGSP